MTRHSSYDIVSTDSNRNDQKVPEVLFAASSFPSSVDRDEIRKIFYELWDIKSLRPLMALVAHSIVGRFYLSSGCDTRDVLPPLKIKFVEGSLNYSFENQGFVAGRTSSDGIELSIAKKVDDKFIKFSSSLIKGNLIHEMHHHAEDLIYNNSMLPYSDKNRELAEFMLLKLRAMSGEAKNIKLGEDIAVSPGVIREQEFFPYSAFKDFTSYPEGNATSSKEIPVRVSQCLGSMVGSSCPDGEKCTEEKAFEIMQARGLSQCVDFFHQEMLLMKEKVRILDTKRETNFSNYEDAVFQPSQPNSHVVPTRARSFIERLCGCFFR